MRDISFLKGKVAVVTGAAGGIGEAICKKLAADYGMDLVITGRKSATLEPLAKELEKTGVRVKTVTGDLSSLGFVDEVIRAANEGFGGFDVLINNAGLSHHCTVEEMTPELFDSIMAVNVRAPYFMCQKALPVLRGSDCATIINICSVVAHKGYVFQSAYAASKHALLGLSKSLANEVYKENIRVHVISPGGVFTPMIALTRPELSSDGMMLPEDIAEMVGFYLEMRRSNAVIDEMESHRVTKEPFA